MKKSIHKYDIIKIRPNIFNLSIKKNEKKINHNWCSKKVRVGNIFLRGEYFVTSPRKAIIIAYDLENGNLIGKLYLKTFV